MLRFHRRRSGDLPRARALATPVSALLAGFVLSLGTTVVGARPVASALAPPSPPPIPTLPTIQPVMSCSALMGMDFSRIPDAPTSLTSATLVGSGQGQYCDVKGWISLQTQFELRLPTNTYQGRYLQTGCGGNCGVVNIGVAQPVDLATAITANTFAVSSNNEGHVSTGQWDVWGEGGKDNPLRAEFGYLADHQNAVVAKAIISAFYGRPPRYSYFDGYSDGGRAAVQEAQRYPTDFNGIVAGAPAIIIQDALIFFDFAAQHLLDAHGQQILDSHAITTLHEAAVAACDASDGLVDGQVSDPRLCHWDPIAIQCSSTRTTNCLTPTQVQVAREMYKGPTTPDGRYLWPGGQSYGSELAWPSFAQAGVSLAGSNLRFLAFEKDPPPSFTFRDLRFDVPTWEALQGMGAVYDANNDNHPDLSAFQRAGGKLLVWQSWQDEAGGAYSVADWYAQVAARAGGVAEAQRFARVFMLPAGGHIDAAQGAIYKLQVLPSLIDWVEAGQAPQKLDAWQTDASGTVTRTYPVYPLPLEARYQGTGDPRDERNWVPFTPISDLHFNWLGDPDPSAPFPYPGFPLVPPSR